MSPGSECEAELATAIGAPGTTGLLERVHRRLGSGSSGIEHLLITSLITLVSGTPLGVDWE